LPVSLPAWRSDGDWRTAAAAPVHNVEAPPECGSPCQLCAKRCPIQAIEPSGAINMDECFYCLDCQVIHNDATVCPPLVYEARRNRKFGVAAPTPAPAGE
jgi:NosR/NirI family nitrous oxide reductase transcriptional regulator